jgi:hypothetical protein
MPTINRGDDYFQVVTYTGNGSTNTITGLRFQPDFVWIKGRSGATDHALYDAVRGTTKDLVSNSTAAETTQSTGLTSFNSDGFTLGALSKVNTNAATYVAWCWKANGAGSSNTSGSITSTVSVNTTAGFSIISWTSTGSNGTIGHGLGVAPVFIIARRRNTAENWIVYHKNMGGNNGYLLLNGTGAFATGVAPWNSTDPTSSVISINNSAMGAGTSNPMITYAWAEIAGFSRFGSYTGNGSTDGTFVYTGFRPKFIMFKRTNDVSDWNILDATRSPYNTSITRLFGNSSNAENSSAGNYDIDILSNGFKQRNTNTSTASNSNLNGSTYIFMAFAENPFKNSLAR